MVEAQVEAQVEVTYVAYSFSLSNRPVAFLMMFLSAGMVPPIYLSIHSPSINFQRKRDGEAGSDGFTVKSR